MDPVPNPLAGGQTADLARRRPVSPCPVMAELAGWALLAVAIVVAAVLLSRRGPERATVRRLKALALTLQHSLQQVQGEIVRLARQQDDLRQDVHARPRGLGPAARRHRPRDPRPARQRPPRAGRGQGPRAGARATAGPGRGQPAPPGGGGGGLVHARRGGREHPRPRARPASARPARAERRLRQQDRGVRAAPARRAATFPSTASGRASASLERLDAPDAARQERKRLVEQVVRDVRGRITEMSEVPRSRAHAEPRPARRARTPSTPRRPRRTPTGYREGVLVVPYSLALPYVLALYRLTLRFGCAVDTDQLADRLRAPRRVLRKLDEEVEGRLSRGLVQLENSREALRDHLGEARRVHRPAAARPTRRPRSAVPRRPLPRCRPRSIDASSTDRITRLAHGDAWRSSWPPAAASAWAAGAPRPSSPLAGRPHAPAQRARLRRRGLGERDRGRRARRSRSTRRASCCAALRKPVTVVAGGRAAAGLGARAGWTRCPRASTASCSCTTPRGPWSTPR